MTTAHRELCQMHAEARRQLLRDEALLDSYRRDENWDAYAALLPAVHRNKTLMRRCELALVEPTAVAV